MQEKDMALPLGKDAAFLQGAIYNIPGIFLFSELIYQLMDIVYDKTGYKLPIKYMYGAPQLRWNNGRLILNNYNSDFSIKGIEKEIVSANERQITPLLTFSNLYVEKADLKDSKCNDVLKMVNEVKGGVIVANDILKQYIAETYPNIVLHASVILTAFKQERNIEYYKKMSQEYECYVVHPDDNFNIDKLEMLPKENAEIILNERCIYNCNIRKSHYESISKEQIAQAENQNLNTHFLDACRAMPEIKQATSKWRNISLTGDEMKKIYNMGYRLFKLQGRTDDLHVFFFDLLRYTLNNEIIFPTIYPIFSFYIEKFKKGANS